MKQDWEKYQKVDRWTPDYENEEMVGCSMNIGEFVTHEDYTKLLVAYHAVLTEKETD
jgi:hypothetical protein